MYINSAILDCRLRGIIYNVYHERISVARRVLFKTLKSLQDIDTDCNIDEYIYVFAVERISTALDFMSTENFQNAVQDLRKIRALFE